MNKAAGVSPGVRSRAPEPNAAPGPAAHPRYPGAADRITREQVERFAAAVLLLPGMPKDVKICVSYGRRNARIYKELCWGWVDMTDGTIRRGSWKAPDMRVPGRGKITDRDIIKSMRWTGPPYL